MLNKLNFEDRVKHELTTKAKEVEVSDLIFNRITNRIESDTGNRSLLKVKFQRTMMRKWIPVSLAAVLIIGGVMFTFSPEVRATTLGVINTIKTIFVLEKSQGEYKIVEKTTEEAIFTPSCGGTTTLSDAELSIKMGFNLTFPETLYGEYKLERKSDGMGIKKKVSEEIYQQIRLDMNKAIEDEAAFNSLSQYGPYRNVYAFYNKEGNTIAIGMVPLDGPTPEESGYISTTIETSVRGTKAVWIELLLPIYNRVKGDGVLSKPDMYTMPNGVSTNYILTWDYNGVRYDISTILQSELAMEEAVKIAESFMAAQ